jgi:hypothetical protein
MIFLNYLTIIFLTMNEIVNSLFILLVSLWDNIGFEGLIIITIIHLASKGKKILDTVAKVITISAWSTMLYNNWVRGQSSGSSDDDKNKKDENKKDEHTQHENKNEK